MEDKSGYRKDLYKAVLKLKDLDECEKFFEDMCTVTELSALEQRYAVATLLMQNKVYVEILEKTNASTATISRVKRMLKYGTGCISKVIERVLNEK